MLTLCRPIGEIIPESEKIPPDHNHNLDMVDHLEKKSIINGRHFLQNFDKFLYHGFLWRHIFPDVIFHVIPLTENFFKNYSMKFHGHGNFDVRFLCHLTCRIALSKRKERSLFRI